MAKPDNYIFHLFEKARWVEAQAKGEYTPESFAKEGFIHFSTKQQLKATAERYYQGQKGLGVLKVEVSRLKAELKYEKTVGRDELYPHLYGPLNTDAVTQIIWLGLTQDGGFLWPEDIQ